VDAQIQQRDRSVEVRQVWLQIYRLILQTREYIYVDNIIRNGKKQQKKIEKTRELDGVKQIKEIIYLQIQQSSNLARHISLELSSKEYVSQVFLPYNHRS
jgi:hypothetical protein